MTDTDPEGTRHEQVDEIVTVKVRDSDIHGGFAVLCQHKGLKKATTEYLSAWLTALFVWHEQTGDVSPRMALAFLNVTINTKDRCGDYD